MRIPVACPTRRLSTSRVVLLAATVVALGALRPLVTAVRAQTPSPVPLVAAPPSVTDAPANPAYGVFYARSLPPDALGSIQRTIGAGTWLSTDLIPPSVPGKLPVVPITPGARPEGEALAALVAQYPAGTAWYLGGEANVPTQGNLPGEAYATYFHDAADVIRSVDLTAVILSASVLNFSETCRGCAGYTSGRDWVTAFRTAYLAQYGEEPPVDAWALDCYLLDWRQLPMIDPTFLPAQITAMRSYLDAIPEQAGKPIWLTEFGVVWAYDDMQWVEVNGDYEVAPAGQFRADLLGDWLQSTLTWLETDGRAQGVARWYLFASTAPPQEPWYHGIELLQTDASGALSLTPLGELYASFARASAPAPSPTTAPPAPPDSAPPPGDALDTAPPTHEESPPVSDCASMAACPGVGAEIP